MVMIEVIRRLMRGNNFPSATHWNQATAFVHSFYCSFLPSPLKYDFITLLLFDSNLRKERKRKESRMKRVNERYIT